MSQTNNNKVFKICKLETVINMSKGAILVFLALCKNSNKEGLSSPSVANIEIESGVTRRSIFRNLIQLKGAGLIRQEGEQDGVTVYRVTRKGKFVLCPHEKLSELKTLSKAVLIDVLEKMSPPPKKMSPPDKKNVTPPEKMAPIIDNITNNYLTNLVNVKDSKMAPPENVTPSELTITEFNCFNLLWEKWRDSPVSRWSSPDYVGEFVKIVKTHETTIKNRDLVRELRLLDAYLMELAIKRLGDMDAVTAYEGTPFVYHGKGWLKCLNRWLSSKTPASITPKRKTLISLYGIKIEETQNPPEQPQNEDTHRSPKNAPVSSSDGVEYPSAAKEMLEGFTGCKTVEHWLRYLLSKEQQFPIYEDRVNHIARDSMKFSRQDIETINRSKSLETLALFVYFRPSNAPRFYSIPELDNWGLL